MATTKDKANKEEKALVLKSIVGDETLCFNTVS